MTQRKAGLLKGSTLLLIVLFIVSATALSAQVLLRFNVQNMLSSDRTGPWTVDYDDVGFPTQDGNFFTFAPSPTYLYHDYAYMQFGKDGSTVNTCIFEDLAFLDGTDGITVEFNNFNLVGFDKYNTVIPLLPWNTVGQAGDHRVYANGYIDFFHNNVLKLRLIDNQIDIRTPYPNRDQIRAFNPVLLGNWQNPIGTGDLITSSGIGEVDYDNSDPAWAAAMANPMNDLVVYQLSNISYQLLFPPLLPDTILKWKSGLLPINKTLSI